MNRENINTHSWYPSAKRILKEVGLASTAGMMAVCFTHPLELTKTRLQLDLELSRKTAQRKYRGWVHCLFGTLRSEGIRGIQRGLSTAILREAIFNGVRIGMYQPVIDFAGPYGANKLICGLFCGAFAGIVCNPVDILKVRLQSQGGLTGYQYQYQGTFNAAVSLYRDEGLAGLFKGVSVNTTRGLLGPGTQLPSYHYFKYLANESEKLNASDPKMIHAISALGSAAVSVACVNPIDVVRTRVYNQPIDEKTKRGRYYRNGIDAARKIALKEGLGSFYKGALTHFGRLGPHMVLVFVFIEELRKLSS